MKKLIVFMSMALVFTISCSKDEQSGGGGGGMMEEDPCEGTSFTYNNDASSIINGSCAIAGCHVDGNTRGLPDFSTYQGIFDRRSSAASRVAAGTMPPSSANVSLTDAQKRIIACWVADGAPQ